MKRASVLIVALVGLLGGMVSSVYAETPRVLVLTDISNEPDDEESLVRFLVYSNEFTVEGLVATTSTWLRQSPREDLIRRQIDAYAQVRPNLSRHASGFPTAESLRGVTVTGQATYAMAAHRPWCPIVAPSSRLLSRHDRPGCALTRLFRVDEDV